MDDGPQTNERGVRSVARTALLLVPIHALLVPFGVLLVLVRAHVALKNSRLMIAVGVLNAVGVLWLRLESLISARCAQVAGS